MPLTKVTSEMVNPDPSDASNLSSGSVPTAQLGNVPPNTGLQNDIATLALHSAIADNKAAFNLTNAFVDQFEDDSGIDTQTNVDNVSEYMASVYGSAVDSDTVLLMHMDGVNDGTTFTDSSPTPMTIATVSNTTTTTSEKKFGTAAMDGTEASNYIEITNTSAINFAANTSFTFDFWVKSPSTGATLNNRVFQKGANSASGFGVFMDGTWIYLGWTDAAVVKFAQNLVVGTGSWHHIAAVRNGQADNSGGDVIDIYLDGVSKHSTADGTALTDTGNLFLCAYPGSPTSGTRFNGYIDEFRISDVPRWTADFSVPTAPYGQVSNATGNWTSTTETANATVSKMGIIVLYKNAYGTAALDTDLVAQVSSDGGSNYTSAPLTAGGTFSSGILVAKSNDITISNTGTAPKYKISFANQAVSSKETQVHGVALIY